MCINITNVYWWSIPLLLLLLSIPSLLETSGISRLIHDVSTRLAGLLAPRVLLILIPLWSEDTNTDSIVYTATHQVLELSRNLQV